MQKNWVEMVAGLSGPLKELRVGIPEVIKSFSSLVHAAINEVMETMGMAMYVGAGLSAK